MPDVIVVGVVMGAARPSPTRPARPGPRSRPGSRPRPSRSRTGPPRCCR